MTSRVHHALRAALVVALGSPIALACGGRAVGDDCQSAIPDQLGACGYSVQIIGDPNACGFNDGGTGNAELCQRLCGQATSCSYFGGSVVTCGNGCPGRKPDGLEEWVSEGGSAVGEWLARAAFFEAASVDAFEILAAELEVAGAPASLIRGARIAAKDEVRHALVMTALAEKYGALVRRPNVVQFRRRSLLEIALENAVEGCVHETFAAAVAAVQGRTAGDERIRVAMARIAIDEARHADLAWRVAGWIEPRLSARDRATVDEARRAAAERLRADEVTGEAGLALGIPDRATADGVARALFEELLAA